MNIVGGENEDSYRKLPEFIQSETAELENISSNFIMKSVCCVWSNFIEKTYFHVPWYLYTWKYTDSVQFVYCLVCCMEMGVPIIARSGSDYISLRMRIDWNKFDAIWPFEPFPMNLLVSGEMFGQAAGFLEHCSPPRARSAIDTFLEKLFTGSLHSSTKYHIFETKCTKFLLLRPNACYQVHQVGSKESELSQKSSASLTCTIQKSWCWWF